MFEPLVIVFLVVLLLLLLIAVILLFIAKLRKINKETQKLEKVINSTSESIFIYDKNKNVVNMYNIDPATTFGHPESFFIGKHVSCFANDKSSPVYEISRKLADSFDRIKGTDNVENFQYKIGAAHLDAKSRTFGDGYILSVCNVTNVVNSRNEYMRKSKNELSMALTAGGLTSWSYDVEGEMFGSMHENNVIGNNMSYKDLISHIHPDDRKIVENSLQNLISKKKNKCDFLIRVTNNCGEMQYSSIHGVPHEFDGDGNVKTLIGSQKDVSEDVAIKNELIKLRDKSEEANRLKSAFLANMSHEIRTPLNAIVGFSHLISTTNDKEEISQYMAIIEQNNDLLLSIINDILDLSKIESGKIDFNFSAVNISNLIQQLKQVIELKVNDGVEVVITHPEADLEVFTDVNRISQVITNLLTNAAKFTNQGSIIFGYEVMEEAIYFFVKDTGIGISETDLPTVFTRFVKLNSFAQGTGLGLPICETIVKLLGGNLGVISTLGEGSTFWFTIPNTPPEAADDDSNVNVNEDDAMNNNTKIKYKILIAEDDLSNYVLYEKILSGYTLLHAWNGEEVIAMFKRHNPSIILMDIRMPEMDGYKSAEIIREMSDDVPIIAITASVLKDEHSYKISRGFTDFVSKPVDKVKLKEIVRRYIKN